MSEPPKPPSDPAGLYEKVAGAKPDDPFGDRAFVAEKVTKRKPRQATKITTEGGPDADVARMEARVESAAIDALRRDVMDLTRVDVEKLAKAEEASARKSEYDTPWTPGADGLPPHCPVTPLGKKRGTFFFLTPDCELIDLDAGKFGQSHLDALFAPNSAYLMAMWGASSAKNSAKRIKYEGVRRNLMDACARRGVFDPADKVRGRGAWKNADGALVLHQGDHILIDGASVAPGCHGDFVYPARPKLAPALGDGAGEAREAARQLLTWLECWPWRRGALDARLALGWIVASLMGAAIDWRPQVMLTGDSGMGKSTLQHLLKSVMRDRLLDVADASAAGLYQTLGYDALGVAFDEFENEDDAKGAAVLRLARLASSGGRVTRGGADGVPTNYQARGAFLFSAINPPAMRPAEQNRTTILALRKPADGAKPPLILAADANDIGRRLIARIVHMWRFWPERLDYYRAQLAALKHSNRGQDQFGTLLAAADIALHEEDPSADEWSEISEALDPMAMGETAGALPNWRRCLNHVLAYQPDQWRSNANKQIGGLLMAYADQAGEHPPQRSWVQKELPNMGLALVRLEAAEFDGDESGVDYLGFAPRHPGLAKVFEATDWSARRGADGAWINALAQAPDWMWRRHRFRIGAAREYGLIVRLDAVLEKEEDDV
jgi:hypothetical protein